MRTGHVGGEGRSDRKWHALTFTTPPTEDDRVGSSAVMLLVRGSRGVSRGVARGVSRGVAMF